MPGCEDDGGDVERTKQRVDERKLSLTNVMAFYYQYW